MANKTSAKQLQWAKDYIESHYDRFNLRVPKGKLASYKEYAESKGMSLTALLNKLIEDEIKGK